MRAKISGLYLLLLVPQACAPAMPKVGTILPTHVTVVEDDAPKYYRIPSAFRDHDLICEEPNLPGTCATVAEVRRFLNSRRAE